MTAPHLDVTALATRLDVLERQNRRFRRMLLTFPAFALAAGLLAFSFPPQKTVEAHRFVVTGTDGTPQAELLAGEGSFTVRLLRPVSHASSGRVAVSGLVLTPNGVGFVDADGKVKGWLGEMKPLFLTE